MALADITMVLVALPPAVQAALELPLDQGLALERELAAELFASEDAKEGLAAHSAKRQAVFRAR